MRRGEELVMLTYFGIGGRFEKEISLDLRSYSGAVAGFPDNFSASRVP